MNQAQPLRARANFQTKRGCKGRARCPYRAVSVCSSSGNSAARWGHRALPGATLRAHDSTIQFGFANRPSKP